MKAFKYNAFNFFNINLINELILFFALCNKVFSYLQLLCATGDTFIYADWDLNEPTAPGQLCAAVEQQTDKWTNYDCASTRHFICQICESKFDTLVVRDVFYTLFLIIHSVIHIHCGSCSCDAVN